MKDDDKCGEDTNLWGTEQDMHEEIKALDQAKRDCKEKSKEKKLNYDEVMKFEKYKGKGCGLAILDSFINERKAHPLIAHLGIDKEEKVGESNT
jgi:hypothetical protein